MSVQILGDCWDTITGCTKISAGCRECYADKFTKWINGMGQTDKYAAGFGVVKCHDDALATPKGKKKPKTYFVNSMADTFHDDVPDEFIGKIFEVMHECPQHTFQVLTKRSERMATLSSVLKYTRNIWQGVTVEGDDYRYRIDDLRKVPAAVRFVMAEPLLGPLKDMDLTGIHWVIVGGENGNGTNRFRPMDVDWVRDIRDQCISAGVKFCFKQFAGKRPEVAGRILDGTVWNERP